MTGKHARRLERRRHRLVRMIVVRSIVSTAMLVGALYGGLATGQHIVAYRQQLGDRHAARPSPACISYLPHGQLDAAHHHRAGLPECYRPPRYAQFDANAKDG
jgi:hypothetical protein